MAPADDRQLTEFEHPAAPDPNISEKIHPQTSPRVRKPSPFQEMVDTQDQFRAEIREAVRKITGREPRWR